MSNDLLAAIDDLVDRKTFTLDGLKAVQDLRAKAEKLAEQLDATKSMLKDRDAEVTRCTVTLLEWTRKDSALQVREENLTKREAAVTDLERKTAVAEAGMNVMRETTAMFLHNRVVRENIVSTQPVAVPGPSGQMGYVQSHQNVENVTREEG